MVPKFPQITEFECNFNKSKKEKHNFYETSAIENSENLLDKM